MANTAVTTIPYTPATSSEPVTTISRGGSLASPRVLLLALLVLSAAYVTWHLGRGWIPHDEGALGQSAVRVLQGDLPHRDFDELYTGGLTYVNAAAFRIFGTTLFAMRLVLFFVFLAWVPAVFYIASRFVPPAAAAGVTLLCVAWSLPNYLAPLPSWYNLFLTVFGVAAVFRWLEDRRPRFLVAAGFAGGLSLLVKVSGLYFVAGALLFLVFQAHGQSRAAAGPTLRRGWTYAVFATTCLLVFCLALFVLVRPQLSGAELVQFVLPGTSVAGFVVWNEWAHPAGASRSRFIALARLLAPFLLGFALPVALFLIPFARGHALGALLNGVFVLPAKRLTMAAVPVPSLSSMLALIPVYLLLDYGRRIGRQMSRLEILGLAAAFLAYLFATASVPLFYRLVWYAVRGVVPVLVIIGVAVVAKHRRGNIDSQLLRSRTMLLVAVSAVFTLVQFPFSAPIYFCYVAPLVILLATALLFHARPMAPAVPITLMVFLIAFAVTRVNTSTVYGMGIMYQPYPQTVSLGLPRAGLDVPLQDAEMYPTAVKLLRQHSRGDYTWASPDSPEMYFLSGMRNPTRSLFDFFDNDVGRPARILTTLDRRGVTAIALNNYPAFSAPISGDFLAELERRYPFKETVGKFQIRWR